MTAKRKHKLPGKMRQNRKIRLTKHDGVLWLTTTPKELLRLPLNSPIKGYIKNRDNNQDWAKRK